MLQLLHLPTRCTIAAFVVKLHRLHGGLACLSLFESLNLLISALDKVHIMVLNGVCEGCAAGALMSDVHGPPGACTCKLLRAHLRNMAPEQRQSFSLLHALEGVGPHIFTGKGTCNDTTSSMALLMLCHIDRLPA